MSNGLDALLAASLGYVLGSIPFGLLLAMAAGKGDVRKIGSGNIGATNVLRTGSKKLAAATLLLDLFKGWLPVFLAWQFWPEVVGFAALGAVIGHCFPVWLGFKGGKGVATAAGVCFGLGWPFGLVYAVTWLGLLYFTRISSFAGMCAAVSAPVLAMVLGRWELVPVLSAMAAIILVLHRENIARLRAGTEPRVGSRK
ncbi:glycerol-3-phosphate 1-O-acyltransferase PlsY [Altererythrobacter indicus]|uniref:Glycerol-3-phosphate acyltransferase n=1 Tax=Altericroceibacterium indicum TaxID=374177 RepID=A0A845A4U8_9SPHN|nr:glycerol-3-phosphate 1-O-acyltransferase PlsY [Altericroceibacterium indicum]MXP24754.1 glycerol-3-phosphate 1-O-acyltransferase PlsY [Altericroceibacterium indicum]